MINMKDLYKSKKDISPKNWFQHMKILCICILWWYYYSDCVILWIPFIDISYNLENLIG